MTTSETAVTRRRFGRMVAVGAIALVLGGKAVTPAEARPRSSAVSSANGAIGLCFESGGDPYYYETSGLITTRCDYADGSSEQYHILYD